MTFTFYLLIVVVTLLQPGCCHSSFSYPVIVDVTKIEVMTNEGVVIHEIVDSGKIDDAVRFIDNRRSSWCSPQFGTPAPLAIISFSMNKGGKAKIGLGDGFFVAEFSQGKYILNLSESEQREFFKILSVDQNLILKR